MDRRCRTGHIPWILTGKKNLCLHLKSASFKKFAQGMGLGSCICACAMNFILCDVNLGRKNYFLCSIVSLMSCGFHHILNPLVTRQEGIQDLTVGEEFKLLIMYFVGLNLTQWWFLVCSHAQWNGDYISSSWDMFQVNTLPHSPELCSKLPHYQSLDLTQHNHTSKVGFKRGLL